MPKKNSHGGKGSVPDKKVSRAARHGKTASNLPDKTMLPVDILEKEIPATDLHDM